MLLASLALASEPQSDVTPTAILPSAAALAAGDGEVAISGGGTIGYGFPLASVHVVAAATDSLAFSTGATIVLNVGLASVGARYLAVNTPNFHLGPWGGAMVRLLGSDGDQFLGPVVGIAGEGGWEHVRFDASVPVFGFDFYDVVDSAPNGLGPLTSSTAGVTVRLGASHRIRAGFGHYLAPEVDYTFVRPGWFLGAGVRLHALQYPDGHATVGVRW